MLPNPIHLDMFWALTNVPDDKDRGDRSEVVNEQKCVLVRAGANRSRCAQSMLPTTTNELVSRDSKHNLGKFPKQNYKNLFIKTNVGHESHKIKVET